MTAFAVALVVVGGFAGASQAAIMGRFGDRIGSLEAVAFAAALTALLALAILLLGRRSLHGYVAAVHQPPWMWTAAAMGMLVVLGITVASPRIGTAATIGILVTGNLLMAAVIDRFGLFGLQKIPLRAERVTGLVLLLAGSALSLKR
ncbi:MAG: DMT family transporter [Gaiellaceae bacterium]